MAIMLCREVTQICLVFHGAYFLLYSQARASLSKAKLAKKPLSAADTNTGV